MSKNLLIFGLAVLLICVGVSGCNESNNSFKSDEDRITGTWVITELYGNSTMTITYSFLANNTYIVTSIYLDDILSFNGIWKIVDNNLVVTIDGLTQTGNYKFSNNDKTLTITNTETNTITVLTKQ